MDKLERVQKAIAKYDYVRFSIHNLQGTSLGQIIPRRNVQKYLLKGLDMFAGVMTYDASAVSIPLSTKTIYNHGNMILHPVLDTLRPVPWVGSDKYKIAEILCESLWRKDRRPQDVCPRYAARKLLQALDVKGLKFLSGVEVEFSLLKCGSLEPVHGSSINSCTADASQHADMLFEFEEMLMEAGVNVERILSEGLEGLFEFVLPPSLGISGPDTTVTVKQGLLEMAKAKGVKVSFLTNLMLDQNDRIPHHLNFSVLSKETNKHIFFDADSNDNLSVVARQWIAGFLSHSKALAAFMLPTPNCYRAAHGHSTPSHIYWGIDDRSALLRVKNHGQSETYIENRLPSSLSNPYLVFAATVAAGLDGMNRKLELQPPGLTEDTDMLPATLSEALLALEDNKELAELMGEELVSSYIKCKRSDLRRFDALQNDEERFQLERKLYL